MATTITKPPTGKVSGLSIERNGRTFKATWKVPSSQTDDSNHRATDRETEWERKGSDDKWHALSAKTAGVSVHSSTITINDAKYWDAEKCHGVRVRVRLKNDKGVAKVDGDKLGGWTAWDEYTVNKPANVTIARPTNNANQVRCEFKAADTSKTHKPRNRTRIIVTRKGKIDGVRLTPKTWKDDYFESESSGTHTFVHTDTKAMNFNDSNDYITYTFKAITHGPGGKVTKEGSELTFKVASEASIRKIEAFKNYIRIDVTCKDSSTTMHLECGKSFSKVVTSWQEVGTPVSGNSDMMLCPRADAEPDTNEHVYFRIRTERMGIASYTRYSDQVECKALYDESKSGLYGNLAILEDEFIPNLTSMGVQLGWKADSNYNGVELSWSTDVNAWRSNKKPDSMQMQMPEWNDGAHAGYAQSTKVYIMDLEEDTTYYFRARRYNSTTGDTSGWCRRKSANTSAEDAGLSVFADKVTAEGEPLQVSWALGGRPQKRWSIHYGQYESGAWVKRNSWTAGGDGKTSVFEIPPERVTGENIRIEVSASNSTSAATMFTKSVTVKVRPRPTVEVTIPEAITALPFTAGISTNTVGAQVSINLVSDGATSNRPDGNEQQFAGDVVWSGSANLSPTGDDVDDPETPYSIEIGEGASLVDNANYHLVVTPVFSGLYGETVESEPVPVHWAHQAIAPEASVTSNPDDLSATIAISAPEGAMLTDSYNVYRTTLTGIRQVASGLADGEVVTDGFAPFSDDGEQAYIVETVTAEGDRDWSEAPYSLACDSLVISWGGNRLYLPYDITIGDSWQKDAENVTYLDGSTEGHWNDGAPLKQSLSTNMLKFGDDENRSLIAALAQYSGSAFVRTPAGHAYEADVQVSSMSYSADSALVSCGLSASEVDNGGFMAERVKEVENGAV